MQSTITMVTKTVSSKLCHDQQHMRSHAFNILFNFFFLCSYFSCWRPTASGFVTVYLAATDAVVQPQQIRVGIFWLQPGWICCAGSGPWTCPSPSPTFLIRSNFRLPQLWFIDWHHAQWSLGEWICKINILRVLAKLHFIFFFLNKIMYSSTK